MALSRPAASNREGNGVTILRDSAHYFDDTLKQFRVCHDLCTASGMLDKTPVSELDQCAVRFRQLSIFGATLSEKVASVWCGTCSMFYRNLDKLQQKDPSKILTTISKNAQELSEGFLHLCKCANVLVSKFEMMKVDSHRVGAVQEKLVEAFRKEERKAADEKAGSQLRLEQAKRKSEAAKEEVLHHKHQWKPSVTLFTTNSSALHKATHDLENAKEMEAMMEKQLKEAEKKLREQKDQTKKAEFLAGELTKLMGMLHTVAAVCHHVGQYFEGETDTFRNMATATTGEELGIKYGLDPSKAKAEADCLAEQKILLEKYHRVMAVINSSYNFQPTFNPGEQIFYREEISTIQLEGLGVSWSMNAE